MKRREKETGVRQGYYLDLTRGEFFHLGGADALPPTKAGNKLIRVPLLAVIAGTPVISLAYVIFLPLAALVGLIAFTGRKLRNTVMAMVHKPPETREGLPG